MKKITDFAMGQGNRADSRTEETIKNTMQREFPLPENVKKAQKEAFEKIREQQGQAQTAGAAGKRKRRRTAFVRSTAGLAATAAAFTLIFVSNPALAANIPLVGHVFEAIGNSMGFSGDYENYARPLEGSTQSEADGEAGDGDTAGSETTTASGEGSEGAAAAADTSDTVATVSTGDTQYSKTVNGVTVTLSEVYCNDDALYLSMLLTTEDAFPDTLTDQEGKPVIALQNVVSSTALSEDIPRLTYLDGEMVDEHTYAGALRFDLSEWEKQFDASTAELPEKFTLNLNISQIIGDLTESSLPEMPQELKDEYTAALKEAGIDADRLDLDSVEDYESLTEEQKETEHALYTEMWNKYAELYPETNTHPNKYENWWYDGTWDFEISVVKNHADTVTKEIGDTDENGLGVISVTKSPFEITVETQEPSDGNAPNKAGYFVVALDANGDILPYGGSGSAETWAIQDRDTSKIDIYICDYVEYMDELKGYYYSSDYETQKETKTFRQLLDERALHHTEVVFES